MPTEPGRGGLPRVVLRADDGGRAEVYLHGAHVTSWTTPDGREQLYLSERAVFDGRAAIRGGVPLEKIQETLLQGAIYCGVPAANLSLIHI